MLHTKHLRPFLAVVRQGNVSRASEELLRAQSAVSRSIQELESFFGIALFERSARRWILTEFGQALLRRVEYAFAELQEACDALCNTYPSAAFRLRNAPFFSLSVHERRLQLLFEFTERKHVSAAAAAVGVSQPAASMALHELEASVGIPLFDRAHSGVALNEAGLLLVAHAKRALAQLRLASTEISALQGVIEGNIVVGALPFSRPFMLPAAIGRVLDAHPNLAVRTLEAPLDTLATALRLGDVDFLVGAMPAEPAGGGLVLEPLVHSPLTVLARADHPLALRETVSLDEIFHAQWVLPYRGTPTRESFVSWISRQGVEDLKVAVESSDLSVIRGLLLETDMITAASRHLFLHEVRARLLATLPISLEGTERTIGILRRTPEHSSPGAQLLIEEIRQVASRQFVSNAGTLIDTASAQKRTG